MSCCPFFGRIRKFTAVNNPAKECSSVLSTRFPRSICFPRYGVYVFFFSVSFACGLDESLGADLEAVSSLAQAVSPDAVVQCG